MATRSGSRAPGARVADDRWAWAALVVLLVAGAVLLVHETRGISFRDDEWSWILYRRGGGPHSLLDAYDDHLVFVGLLVYKLLLATAGLSTYLPYRLVGVAAQLVCVALVFAYARPRVGTWLASLAGLLVVGFGPGADAFLWPFNDVTIVFAVDAGLAALLLLDRGERRADVGAAVLLAIALASDDVGLAVTAGVLVDLLARRRWRELWVAGAPLALYALWFVAYEQPVQPSPLGDTVRFIGRAAASVMSSLTGLSGADVLTASGGHFLRWGIPLLVVGLIALGWQARRRWRAGEPLTRLLSLGVIVLGFWILVGVGRSDLRFGPLVLAATGHEGRYVYVGAVFVLLLIVEAARGAQGAPVWARALVGILVVAAAWSNFGSLRDDAHYERSDAQLTRASLGAVEITRSIVKPTFPASGFVFSIVHAGPYLAAVRSLGSPAATQAEIAGDPAAVRAFVDMQLIRIHDVRLVAAMRCASGQPAARPDLGIVAVPAGGLLVRAGAAPVPVGVRRFGSGLQSIGTVPAGSRRLLQIGPDASARGWQAEVSGGTVTTCGGR